MKRIALAAIMALALVAVIPAQAQLRLGIKGGANLVSNELSDLKDATLSQLTNTNSYTGFFVGPKLEIGLPISGFDIEAALLYSQKGMTLADKDTYKMQSLVLPVNLRWGLGLGNLARVFVAAGPELAYNMGETLEFVKNRGDEGIASYTISRSALNANVGVGAQLFGHLQASINYSIPCGNTADVKFLSKKDINEVSEPTEQKDLSSITLSDFQGLYDKYAQKYQQTTDKVDALKGRISTGTLQLSIAYIF